MSLSRLLGSSAALLLLVACATMPKPRFSKFYFPKDVYVEPVKRPYTVLGTVRSKVNYTSLDMNHEEADLCKNYYNKAVAELLKYARAKQADAVVDVRSVVFLEDGQVEIYKTPECSDDGGEGQILTQGTAVRWKHETGIPAQAPRIAPAPAASSAPR